MTQKEKPLKPSAKKVEYVELIYDLVFVYLSGRNDEMLDFTGSFFSWEAFEAYLLSTFVILQVWIYSTLYINRYGRDRAKDYVFLFINMYLLFYLASGTRPDWTPFFAPYQAVWALIIINLCVHYCIQLRNGTDRSVLERRYLKRRIAAFAVQAGVILASIPVYEHTGVSCVWISLMIGFLAPVLAERSTDVTPISSEHLTERVMLFVVLTFGETIVSVAEYFDEGISERQLFFSGCAFLVVATMLFGYGYLYRHVIDRENLRSANRYMLVHLFLVVAINDITIGLDIMREPATDDYWGTIFMVLSFLLYFACLLIIVEVGGKKEPLQLAIPFAAVAGIYAVLCLVLYRYRAITSVLSVLYTCLMLRVVIACHKGSRILPRKSPSRHE